MVGGGWRRIRQSSSTSSAATVIGRRSCPCRPASMPPAAAAGSRHERRDFSCGGRAGGEGRAGGAGGGRRGLPRRWVRARGRAVFRPPATALAGESYVGRVLVLDAAKGGVATAWMLHEMTARGVVPAALVLNAVNPIMVQGAAFADFTMISGFDRDITQAIANGAWVEVDPTGE